MIREPVCPKCGAHSTAIVAATEATTYQRFWFPTAYPGSVDYGAYEVIDDGESRFFCSSCGFTSPEAATFDHEEGTSTGRPRWSTRD